MSKGDNTLKPNKIMEMNEFLSGEKSEKVVDTYDIPQSPEHISKITFLREAKYNFKRGDTITYGKKAWKVKTITKDWVELADTRGFNKIVDFVGIKSFKNGVLIAETENLEEIAALRVLKMLGYGGGKVVGGALAAYEVFKFFKTVAIKTLKLQKKYFRVGKKGTLLIPLDNDFTLEFRVDKATKKIHIKTYIIDAPQNKPLPLKKMKSGLETLLKAFIQRYNNKDLDKTINNPTFWGDVAKLKKHVDLEKPWESKDSDGSL